MTPDEVVSGLEKIKLNSNALSYLPQNVANEVNVLSSAISLIQDYQKLREKFVGLDKFLNDWLSQRHGIKYDGVLSRDLSQLIVTFLGCGENLP